MSDEWESLGLDEMFPILPPYVYRVRNLETGAVRRVYVNISQEVGEAIANGQWYDDEEDEED